MIDHFLLSPFKPYRRGWIAFTWLVGLILLTGLACTAPEFGKSTRYLCESSTDEYTQYFWIEETSTCVACAWAESLDDAGRCVYDPNAPYNLCIDAGGSWRDVGDDVIRIWDCYCYNGLSWNGTACTSSNDEEVPSLIETLTPTDEPAEETPTTVTCECQGVDEVCSDGTTTTDSVTCLVDCACDAELSLVCNDGVTYAEHPLCVAGCACEGDDMVCADGTTFPSHESCVTSAPSDFCGDGVCNPDTETVDTCSSDCACVDDGMCDPTESATCADCTAVTGGSCGASCTDDSQCAIEGATNSACSNGVCWDACVCGGECGDDGGGASGTSCPIQGQSCANDADCVGGACNLSDHTCYCP